MFNKKQKQVPTPPRTLQSVQDEFNQNIFALGDLTYRISMVKIELEKLNDSQVDLFDKLDTLGKEGKKLHDKAQSELTKTIKQGTDSEGPKDVS
jgi:hypothetical protein